MPAEEQSPTDTNSSDFMKAAKRAPLAGTHGVEFKRRRTLREKTKQKRNNEETNLCGGKGRLSCSVGGKITFKLPSADPSGYLRTAQYMYTHAYTTHVHRSIGEPHISAYRRTAAVVTGFSGEHGFLSVDDCVTNAFFFSYSYFFLYLRAFLEMEKSRKSTSFIFFFSFKVGETRKKKIVRRSVHGGLAA